MIKPTVGRVIQYWPHVSWIGRVLSPAQPFKADVVFVHEDGRINVAGFDHMGKAFADEGIEIWDGEGVKPASAHAQWMPYQKAVAAGEIPAVKHAT